MVKNGEKWRKLVKNGKFRQLGVKNVVNVSGESTRQKFWSMLISPWTADIYQILR